MTDFTAIIDEATGTTAGQRREQLDAQLNARLAQAGAETFRPLTYPEDGSRRRGDTEELLATVAQQMDGSEGQAAE